MVKASAAAILSKSMEFNEQALCFAKRIARRVRPTRSAGPTKSPVAIVNSDFTTSGFTGALGPRSMSEFVPEFRKSCGTHRIVIKVPTITGRLGRMGYSVRWHAIAHLVFADLLRYVPE